MVARRSRQLKNVSAETGIEDGYAYCRRCMKIKITADFHSAVDLELDKNGFLSVCKDCVNELYINALTSENGVVQLAILKLCHMLNIMYNEEAIVSAQKQTETNKSDLNKLFGLYKSKLKVILGENMGNNVDLTYKDNPIVNVPEGNTLKDFDERELEKDVISFWGEGKTTEDYAWLEKTFDEWKKTHKSDTMAEQTLLKEIVFKQLEIEKARKGNQATTSLVKDLQEIMKTAALDPTKANAANAGRSQETFSAFIKTIEENEPAEYYKDREIFKDFDNIGKYFETYVSRPIKNFITGSRDFNIDQEEDLIDDEDAFDSQISNDGDLSDNVVSEGKDVH